MNTKQKKKRNYSRVASALIFVSLVMFAATWMIFQVPAIGSGVGPEVPSLELRTERLMELQSLRAEHRVALSVISNKGPAWAIPLIQKNSGSVPVEIVTCIIFRESRWNPNAIGSQGEVGLMQVKPTTAGLSAAQLRDPATNIKAGCKKLHSLYEQFGGWGMAIAAYASGEYAANIRYSESILREAGR